MLKAYQYSIPLSPALKTSRQQFHRRKGLFITFNSGNRLYWGETAPLPGFSKESLNAVKKEFLKTRSDFGDIFNSDNPVKLLDKFHQQHQLSAALSFGVDTIAYQIAASNIHKSLQNYLFPNAPSSIPVNTLGDLTASDVIQQVQKSIDKKIRTIKFKVGADFTFELEQLKKIRHHFPDLTIRVDANRAWNLEKAITNCCKLNKLSIEYCEEPLKESIPSNYQKLSSQTTLPLAIDESVVRTNYWQKLLPFTSYIIIKPMLIGSFLKIFETKRLADTHDNRVIFTSSLESGIGRIVTAILASGLGSEHAHGLATGSRLAEDLLGDSKYIKSGYYQLPQNRKELAINPGELQKISSIKLLQ